MTKELRELQEYLAGLDTPERRKDSRRIKRVVKQLAKIHRMILEGKNEQSA